MRTRVEEQPDGEVWVDVPLQGLEGISAEFVLERNGEVTFWGLTVNRDKNWGTRWTGPLAAPVAPPFLADQIREAANSVAA